MYSVHAVYLLKFTKWITFHSAMQHNRQHYNLQFKTCYVHWPLPIDARRATPLTNTSFQHKWLLVLIQQQEQSWRSNRYRFKKWLEEQGSLSCGFMKECISFWMKPIFKDKPLTTKINLKIIHRKEINIKTTDYTDFLLNSGQHCPLG